jgi:hypothetical protein
MIVYAYLHWTGTACEPGTIDDFSHPSIALIIGMDTISAVTFLAENGLIISGRQGRCQVKDGIKPLTPLLSQPGIHQVILLHLRGWIATTHEVCCAPM